MTIQEQVDVGVQSAFDKIKGLFTPKASELDKAVADLATANKKIADLEGSLATALEAGLAQKERIIQLEGELKEKEKTVEARANFKALAIEQERGAKQPVKEEENPSKSAKSMAEQYREMQADNPRAAGAFFAKHRSEILN